MHLVAFQVMWRCPQANSDSQSSQSRARSHGAPACGMHHTACQRKSRSFSRSLSDPCLAHTHECERLRRPGLIQHWVTSPKQLRHSFRPFVGFFFFLLLEQIVSRHQEEWVTCPSYTGASSALWGVFWSLPTFYEPIPTHTYTLFPVYMVTGMQCVCVYCAAIPSRLLN